MPLLSLLHGDQLDPIIKAELEQLIATLNQYFGGQFAIGRWINVVHSPTAFQVVGAGDTWVVNPISDGTPYPPQVLSYTLLGESTMLLNITIRGGSSVLTLPVAANRLQIRIPDQYVAVGGTVAGGFVDSSADPKAGHETFGLCWISQAAGVPGILCAEGQFVYVFRTDLANFVAGAVTIMGHIIFEVKRR